MGRNSELPIYPEQEVGLRLDSDLAGGATIRAGEMGRSRATQDSNLLAQVVRVSSYSQSLSFSPRDGARSLGVARVESIDPTRLTCRTRDHLPYLLLVLHQGPELSPLVPTT